MPRNPWTPEENAALLAAGLTPHTERWTGESRLRKVARRLGRTETASRSRLYRLMQKAGHEGGQWTTEGLWTEAEDHVIRGEMVKGIGNADWISVGARLGRTSRACAVRAYNLRKRSA